MTVSRYDYHASARRFEDFLIAAIDRKRQAPIWPIRVNRSKTSCEFLTGPVTEQMAKHAAFISEIYYRKRVIRSRRLVRRGA